MLIVGTDLWVLTIPISVLTLNATLVPTRILLRGFLVPFSVIFFAAERVGTMFPIASLMVTSSTVSSGVAPPSSKRR